MNVLQRNFFRLLRSGTFGSKEQLEPLSTWKWDKLYRLSLMHGVAALIYDGMMVMKDDFFLQLTDAQWALWKKTVAETENQNKETDIQLSEVFSHLNKEKLESITGASKEIIFNNLDYLSKTCKEKVIIRTPVIPGFNEEIVKDIILYAKEKGFKEVNLLPYHSLGKNKWHNLKKDYVYENEKMMDKSHLSSYTELGKELNIYVKIGG